MTIAEAKQLQDKQMVTQISGRVTRVGQVRTGQGEYGPWTVQDIDLEDATGKIKVNVWDHQALAIFMGHLVILSPTRSDKGWNGLTVIDNTYQGKTTKQLKLTKAGVIEEMPKGPGAEMPAETPTDKPGAALTPAEQSAFQPKHSNGNGKIPWNDYMTAMRVAHKAAANLEQEDAHARATLVNTALIAFSRGEIASPTQEDLDEGAPF